MSDPVYPSPCQYLVVLLFLFYYFDRYGVICHFNLNLHILMRLCAIYHINSSLVKCLFMYFDHFIISLSVYFLLLRLYIYMHIYRHIHIYMHVYKVFCLNTHQFLLSIFFIIFLLFWNKCFILSSISLCIHYFSIVLVIAYTLHRMSQSICASITKYYKLGGL